MAFVQALKAMIYVAVLDREAISIFYMVQVGKER